MSRERNTSKSSESARRLSDTQLVLLSAAAQRDDHCLTTTPKLKGGAARNVAEKLIAAGLVEEIKAKAGVPIWRRDEETAQSFALRLTAAGLGAIAVDAGCDERSTGGADIHEWWASAQRPTVARQGRARNELSGRQRGRDNEFRRCS